MESIAVSIDRICDKQAAEIDRQLEKLDSDIAHWRKRLTEVVLLADKLKVLDKIKAAEKRRKDMRNSYYAHKDVWEERRQNAHNAIKELGL